MERIHHVIANLVCKFDVQNNYLDEDEPWSDILLDTDFSVQVAYHTTFQATPVQMVFICDTILNTPFISDWEAIRRNKKHQIYKNNQTENKNSKLNTYIVIDKLPVSNRKKIHMRCDTKVSTK